jgi:hypothetical protein
MSNIIFAQSFDFNVNFFPAVNITYCNIKNENRAMTEMTLNGIPLGINMFYFFNNRIGINAYFNYTIVAGVMGGFTSGGTRSFNEENLKSVYTFDAFIGPVFDLLGRKNFSMTLAVGFHLTHTYTEIDVPTTVFYDLFNSMEYEGTQFGLGATFGFRYIFDTGFYFMAGLRTSIDFLGEIEAKGETFDGRGMSPTDTSFTLGFSFFFGAGYKIRMKAENDT